MFVPRALRLKGVKESPKAPQERPAKRRRTEDNALDPGKIVSAVALNYEQNNADLESMKASKSTTPAITPEYLGQLICGIELVFTDYAHQDKEGSSWLMSHYREVDGKGKYIHLSSILEHPNISSLKPAATQKFLQQALHDQPSKYIESSTDGYFVRRCPQTYPLKFVPSKSLDIVDENGLGFWEQRTIYVEPHIRGLCKTPAKIAHYLKEHGQMREKWFPVQAVQTLYNSCAFVILSGNMTHESTWDKWRELERPEFWKIMTKIEHMKRTNEYLVLLKEEKGRQGSIKEAERVTGKCALEPTRRQKSKSKKRSRARKKTEQKRKPANTEDTDQEHAEQQEDSPSQTLTSSHHRKASHTDELDHQTPQR